MILPLLIIKEVDNMLADKNVNVLKEWIDKAKYVGVTSW